MTLAGKLAHLELPESINWAVDFLDQCSRIRIFRFFQISKNMTLRFFEMTYEKVVKSHQQKFSPQDVTEE